MKPAKSDLASALRVLGAQGWFSQRSKATRARLLVATSVPTLQRVGAPTCQRRVCEKQLCPGPDIGS
jgi:hypothetical protein